MSKTLKELKKEMKEEWLKSSGISTVDFIKQAMDKTAEETIKAVEVEETGHHPDFNDLQNSEVEGFNQAVQEQKQKANKFLGL